MKEVVKPNENVAPFADEELAKFKIFYRQKLTSSLLKHYVANPLQFDIDLKCCAELERICSDNDYHFENDDFEGLFLRWGG